MPEKLQRFAFKRFDGGWHVAGDPRNIADNECYTLENMLPSRYGGALHARLGWYRVSAQTPDMASPTWMYYWPEEDKYVIVQRTAGAAQGAYAWVIYRIDSDGQNKTTVATSGVGGIAATTHELPHVVSYGYGASNALFIAWGEKIASYTVAGGLVNPHDAACPKASYLVVRFDQLWACGDDDNEARVHRCDTLDPTDWTTGNGGFFDVSAGDGGEVTSIYDHLGDLWMFKGGQNPSIWICRGTPSGGYTIVPYKRNSPDVYRYSHETTLWGLVLASRGAISLLLGSGEQAIMVDISKPIKSWVHAKMGAPYLGQGVMAYSAKFDTLFVKVETTGAAYTATSMLMCRLIGRQAAWAEYKGVQIACPLSGDVLIGLNEQNNEQLMCYGEDYNKVVTGIILADQDTQWRSVVWKVETKETDCGAEAVRKNARSAICDVNVDGTITQTATGSIYANGGAAATDTVSIDGQGDNKERQRTNIRFDTIRAMYTGSQVLTTPVGWQDVEKLTRVGTIGFDYRFMHDVRRTQV